MRYFTYTLLYLVFDMGTKKKDKEFLWLKVLHLIEDVDTKDISKVHK